MKNGALFVIVPLLFLQAACESQRPLPAPGATTNGTTTTGPTAGTGLATKAGASVLSSDVTQASLRSLGGGFGPAVPASAPCDLGVSTFTIGFAPPTLTYSRCKESGDFSSASSYTPQSGQLPLDSAQFAMVRAALGAVTVSDRRGCGADKGIVELEVDTATQNLSYGDDFYQCENRYTTFVGSDQLDNLYAVLNALLD